MRKAAPVSVLLAATTALLIVLGSHADAQTKSCSDFATQQEAQAYYDAHKNDTPGNPDPNHLDADGDGKACEGLPNAPGATTSPVVAPASTSAPLPNNGAETGVMALSGLSLLEAGYGMTLLARRYGVKRRNIPVYLLRKLVSAGKSGQTSVAIGDDFFLVHQSALVATADETGEYLEFEFDDVDLPEHDDSIFKPPSDVPRVSLYAALAKGAEIVEEPAPIVEAVVEEAVPDDVDVDEVPWDDEFAWRV